MRIFGITFWVLVLLSTATTQSTNGFTLSHPRYFVSVASVASRYILFQMEINFFLQQKFSTLKLETGNSQI
jgi:hypothetical protein